MGDGWSFTYGDTMTPNTTDHSVTWFTGNGLLLKFTWNGSAYVTPPTIFGTLTAVAGGYLWTDKTGAETTFTDYTVNGSTVGCVTQIVDRYGNGAYIERNSSGQIVEVCDLFEYDQNGHNIDLSTRWLKFTYTGSHITAITDFSGRTWTYGYDSAGRLASVTAPVGAAGPASVVRYGYFDTASDPSPALNDLLQSVTDPNGNVTAFSYYVNRRGFQVGLPDGAARRPSPTTRSATARPTRTRTGKRPITTMTATETSRSRPIPMAPRWPTRGTATG